MHKPPIKFDTRTIVALVPITPSREDTPTPGKQDPAGASTAGALHSALFGGSMGEGGGTKFGVSIRPVGQAGWGGRDT
jgi:hypothetical protein